MGKVATQFTKDFIGDNLVRLEYDIEKIDKYGRLLAFVYVANKCLNEELIRSGMAKVVKYEPNVAKYDEYKEIEREIRPTGIGIWEDIAGNYPSGKEKKSVSSSVSSTLESSPIKTTSVKKKSVKSTPVKNTISNGYIGNANTHKFHRPGCSAVRRMKESNKVTLKNRETAINQGYIPCKICKP